VVCAPHFPRWDEGHMQQIRTACTELRGVMAEEGIELALRTGFEVDLEVAASASREQLEALVIEGSQGALLLEMPYSGWPVFMEELVFQLATTGFRPVLAHPERNDRVQRSSDLLAGCLRAGAVAQATAASLTGEFGKGPAQTLCRLLSEGHIGLLASDAHAYRKDCWTMEAMLAGLADFVDEDSVAVLTEANPKRLLAGQSLLPISVASGSRARSRGIRRRRRRDTV
jgi:protein-tyrosine phosphatase